MSALRDLLICELVELALSARPIAILLGALGGGIAAVLLALIARVMRRAPAGEGTASPGPAWVFSALVALAIYAGARLLDPLLMSRIGRPAEIDADRWARISFFEWRIFGSPWVRPLLPLSDHPGAAIALHALAWCAVVIAVRAIVEWIVVRAVPGGLGWSTAERDLPFFHRWVGATTARRADQRWKVWMVRLVAALALVHASAGWLTVAPSSELAVPGLACGGEPAAAGPAIGAAHQAPRPAPGTWVIAGLVLLAVSMHLATEGRPPAAEPAAETTEERKAGPPPTPALARLLAALPGSPSPLVVREAAREAETSPIDGGVAGLAAEITRILTGGETLWSHQREVLEHLVSTWKARGARSPGAAPALREEGIAAPFAGAREVEHLLVLAPEGSGRSTLALIAALHVTLDRGATALVIARDRDGARTIADRLGGAIQGSAARWNVPVAVAGDDLASALVAQRTPAIVVAHLEALEADVLADRRTDPIFERLGLVVVEDLDAFTGVAEMHLHMAMRRCWSLLDSLHDAPYPTILLATAGPSASGLAAWARRLLAVPLRVFDRDGAPRPPRAIVRRRDLAGTASEPTIAALAEACERAGLRWHLRLAGDADRAISRAAIDLPHLRGHVDPLDAEVVLIEGRAPEVRREADRLAHAGLRAGAEALIVLAAPSDEELVLHEEADDAPLRSLVESLPRCVSLSEPEVVRQRHFDRALGREQDVAALRARFGAAFVDETLERMRRAERIAERTLLELDPRSDDARPRVRVRSASEAAIGEPISASCVGESATRVALIDEGTREPLRELDGSIAIAAWPPGSLLLDRRGRYLVRDPGSDPRVITAAHGAPIGRTTPDRALAIELSSRVERSERSLGGAPLRIALARAEVIETFHAIRRYAPGPAFVERRHFPQPLVATYSTEVCLVWVELPRAAEVPLAAALRMMLPCLVRAADGLADCDVVAIGTERAIAIVDRTPGSSGIARWAHDEGIGDLLRLARAALERLVGTEAERLHALHDTSLDGEALAWRTHDALAWLDRVLDAPGRAAEPMDALGYTEGEGPGDLGRLWVAPSGRADDLAWTRHAWASDVALGRMPPGPVHLDVAVERREIARALREARGAPEDLAWSREAIARASQDLAPIAARLRAITGERYADAVLALVAAIPTRAEPLEPAERAPLVALARRRADPIAKALIAYVLLRDEGAAVIELASGPVIQLADAAFDLGRAVPRRVAPEELAGAHRALG